jgi:hypothetical protein
MVGPSRSGITMQHRLPSLVTALVGLGAALTVLFVSPAGEDDDAPLVLFAEAEAGDCPKGMVSIGGDFCIDQFEASLDEIAAPRKGKKAPKVLGRHSPYKPVDGLVVMAVSERGRTPQGYISRNEAEEACFNAGKRLCSDDEWLSACKGKSPTQYPYGDEHEDGRCNDAGTSSFNLLYGPGNNQPPEQSTYTRENMNDPRLNQMDGTVAKSGSFKKCKNSYKVYDMVGNLHEWTAASSGTFRGGYYLDTKINGEGCDYRTTAHDARYHDYSTGFRCCYGGPEQKKVDKMLRERGKSAAKSGDDEAASGAKSKQAEDKSSTKKKRKKKSKKDEPQKVAHVDDR